MLYLLLARAVATTLKGEKFHAQMAMFFSLSPPRGRECKCVCVCVCVSLLRSTINSKPDFEHLGQVNVFSAPTRSVVFLAPTNNAALPKLKPDTRFARIGPLKRCHVHVALRDVLL
jgi:hypothetical protein